jgi:septum site-determining protein MinC
MASQLLLATTAGQPHWLRLGKAASASGSVVEEVGYALGALPPSPGPLGQDLVLATGDWLLTVADLRALEPLLLQNGLRLIRVESPMPEALVAAASLGLVTQLHAPGSEAAPEALNQEPASQAEAQNPALTIHQGTLRSGDHLQVEGSVLLLGDVNPGARISAAGDVRVWGRLRGIAHAGCQGNRQARIVALQLRPLQLRIAEAVARGPEDLPPLGYAEQAQLVAGAIAIEPAEPTWGLPDLGP